MMGKVFSNTVHYTIYKPEGIDIRAAILLLHGMEEHSGRYEELAGYLKKAGYAVLTYDHIGHGLTAKTADQMGFLDVDHPQTILIAQAKHMAALLAQSFPGIPLFLMAHSMGSFVARLLLSRIPNRFRGTVLIGTGGPNLLAALALPALRLANWIAPHKKFLWLNKLFSNINNRQFKHENPNDGINWLSARVANRQAFQADPLCGRGFSSNAFLGLVWLNVQATRYNWAAGIPRTMPFLFLSGTEDPIGNFGKGVEKTVKSLRQQGFEQVTMKLYTDMRHEILHEDNRQRVFEDIVEWLNSHQ